MKLKIKYLFPGVIELSSCEGDSGYDLRAHLAEAITIEPNGKHSFGTGIAAELVDYPAAETLSYELQVRPRSGHTARGIVAQFGTIDAAYRGEIWVTLFNFGKMSVTIEPDERIAQLVVCPIYKPQLETVRELSATARGSNGFGSTGKD